MKFLDIFRGGKKRDFTRKEKPRMVDLLGNTLPTGKDFEGTNQRPSFEQIQKKSKSKKH